MRAALRRELCVHAGCTAHEAVIERILKLIEEDRTELEAEMIEALKRVDRVADEYGAPEVWNNCILNARRVLRRAGIATTE